jgi:hypothetical protein
VTTRETHIHQEPTRRADLGLAFATYHLSGKFGGSHSIIP